MGSCGSGGGCFDTRGSFFLDFLAVGLVAARDLGLGFLGLTVFLVAFTVGCLCASVNG